MRLAQCPQVLCCSLVLALAADAASSAETYDVFSCRGPDGASIGSAGWQGSQSGPAEATPGCAASGIGVALTGLGPWPGGVGANQQFTAPANTRITRLRMRRTTQGLAPSAASAVGYFLRADARVLEGCTPGPGSTCVGDLAGNVDAGGLDVAHVRLNAGCGAFFPGTCAGGPLRIDVERAIVTLRDAEAPVVRNARVTARSVSAPTLRVGFDADDRGSGVYRVVTKVDGVVTAVGDVGPPSCRDLLAGDQDAFQFVEPVPCPLSTRGLAADIDLRNLPQSEHILEVLAQDAAGNTAPVYGPLTFPRLNIDTTTVAGSSGSRVQTALDARVYAYFQENKTVRLGSRYGTRVVVRGNLRDSKGKAVVGARLDVYHLIASSKRLLKTGLKSRTGGRFTMILPMNIGTRRIQIAYRALRPGPVTSRRTLSLTVRDAAGTVVVRPLDDQGPTF